MPSSELQVSESLNGDSEQISSSLPISPSGVARSALVPVLNGKKYYVAKTGLDTNDGSITKPLKTFKNAISRMKAGDSLFIRGGLYTEQIDFQGPNKTGTASAWIKVAGYPGEVVTIQYTDPNPNDGKPGYGPIRARGNRGYFNFENLILDGIHAKRNSTWEIRDGNHHFVLRKIEMKNFFGSPLKVAGSYVEVLNSKFHDQTRVSTSRLYCMYISKGSNIVIDGNECYKNIGGGIHLYYGPLVNVVIRNNIVRHNSFMDTIVGGILVWGVLSGSNGNGNVDGVQIYNNLVYSNCVNQPPGSPVCGGILVSGTSTKNVKVWNNTVYGNRSYGISIAPYNGVKPVNTVVQNNIVYGNKNAQIINDGLNSVIDHNLTTDPQFVSTTASNFRLKSSSPAVNKGRSISSIKTDITGTARPKGGFFDIGAYESY